MEEEVKEEEEEEVEVMVEEHMEEVGGALQAGRGAAGG